MSRSLPVLLATLLLLTASMSLAGEPEPVRAPESATGGVSLRMSSVELNMDQIFEILCGGAEPSDPALTEHLWRIAKSLAQRSWTPPTMSVRTVVHSSVD